jgi:hypothetical protein
MPVMPTRLPKKNTSRRRSAKKQQPALKGFLLLLVVFISLAIIAFAATHVYVRLNKQTTNPATIEQPQPQIADTVAIVEPTHDEPPKTEMQKKPEFEPGLAGTWVSNSSSAMITFEGDNYTLDLPSVEDIPIIKGSFSLSSGTIILKTAEGPHYCPKTTGRYTYKLKGDELTLRLQSDGCKTRSNELNSSFFRLYGKF